MAVVLLAHGVPWNVVMRMSRDAMLAWTIAVGNYSRPVNKQYDWVAGDFPE